MRQDLRDKANHRMKQFYKVVARNVENGRYLSHKEATKQVVWMFAAKADSRTWRDVLHAIEHQEFSR